MIDVFRSNRWIVILWLSATVPQLSSGADLSSLRLKMIATELEQPVAVTHAGDPRLFVVTKRGRILIFDGEEIRQQPFLDVSDRVRTHRLEQGLFSVAFHPRFAQNGCFFVSYTDLNGDTALVRYRVSADPDVAEAASARVLTTIRQPFNTHNGGQLQFGPDGYLYVGSGDGGGIDDPDCKAQDADSLLGKILRIDVDQNVDVPPYYGIPPGNPFAGPGAPRDEIWAVGLRNPWRFSFDRSTGELYIGDVGQREREEINLQPAGGGGENYGWKMLEGTLCRNNEDGCVRALATCDDPVYVPPILEYAHGAGTCAVIGGYVYRGQQIPELAGKYLYGDFCSGRLWAAELEAGSWHSMLLAPRLPGLTSFGEDQEGELYLTAGSGLYQLTDRGTLAFTAAAFDFPEEGGEVAVSVRRTGAGGLVGVDYTTLAGSATVGEDYVSTSGTLTWDEGDEEEKTFRITILPDGAVEGNESLTLELSNASGGAALGVPAKARLTIVDDDLPAGPCIADGTTLCLNGGRFRVTIDWRTDDERTGAAPAVPLTDDAGYFWFFGPENPEVFVKVLDACAEPGERFWVFAAGLTDIETRLTVIDTHHQLLREYRNPPGVGFAPIRDTGAFASCP